MQAYGQLQAPTAVPLEKEATVPMEYQADLDGM